MVMSRGTQTGSHSLQPLCFAKATGTTGSVKHSRTFVVDGVGSHGVSVDTYLDGDQSVDYAKKGVTVMNGPSYPQRCI